MDPAMLAAQVKAWGRELGFQKVGIAAIDLEQDERRLLEWLAAGRHSIDIWLEDRSGNVAEHRREFTLP